MYVLYLDDSGSTKNSNEDYLVLGGLSIFERQVHWVSEAVEKLAESLLPEDPGAVEFHASSIFSGREAPWNGLTKEKRIQVIKEILSILGKSHASTRAFACAVHKKSFPNTDPMELAFEELCNRFDLQLKRLHFEGDTQRGMIILDDSTYETTLQGLARNFRYHGTRWGVLRNIVDVPFFVNSRASRCVQVADHVAYSVFRRYQAGDTSYLDIIMSKFDSERGKLHGLTHKQSFDPNCMCPACMSRRLGAN
jgi:hypothetical protein